jgi:flagellar capping protein FliD
LEASASVLTSEEEENVFAQAREAGNTDAVKKQVQEFISDYNDVVKNLGSSSSALNTYYKQMLEEAYSDSEESLSNIGISMDKKGYLRLDESKFAGADIDTLETALGKTSVFSTKAGFIASRVANNAESYLESLSSQYSATGRNYSSYLSSKYDLWG